MKKNTEQERHHRYNRSARMVRYDTMARNVSIHFPMAYSVILWSLYLLYLLSGLHMVEWTLREKNSGVLVLGAGR